MPHIQAEATPTKEHALIGGRESGKGCGASCGLVKVDNLEMKRAKECDGQNWVG